MHVPGHKNMTIGYLNRLDLAMDMTEITGLDDMHYPEGIILESMENFRKHKNYDALISLTERLQYYRLSKRFQEK